MLTTRHAEIKIIVILHFTYKVAQYVGSCRLDTLLCGRSSFSSFADIDVVMTWQCSELMNMITASWLLIYLFWQFVSLISIGEVVPVLQLILGPPAGEVRLIVFFLAVGRSLPSLSSSLLFQHSSSSIFGSNPWLLGLPQSHQWLGLYSDSVCWMSSSIFLSQILMRMFSCACKGISFSRCCLGSTVRQVGHFSTIVLMSFYRR